MVGTIPFGGWARRNWFLPMFALLLGIEYAFVRSVDWAREPSAEAVVLFDMALFVPALFLLCYRRRLARRALLIRTAALACLGVTIASLLVPPDAQHLVAGLGRARWIGLAMLAFVELWVVALAVRLVFGGASTEEISARSGAPQWIARLMQLEARFWKAVWRLVTGR